MNTVLDIVNQLENTSGSKGKLNILQEHKDNELLQKVLYYTYNDSMYGLTRDTIIPTNNPDTEQQDMFSVLDTLAVVNINDNYRTIVNEQLGLRTPEEAELWIRVLTKDLRCGISLKTIQKVFPNMFPTWGCMLGSKYFDHQRAIEGKAFTLTIKLDGHRIIILKQGDNVECYTRQHKPYEGLTEIIEEVRKLDYDNIVIDGELLVANYKDIPPETRYKVTSNIVRKDGEKTGAVVVAFDVLPLEDFNKGIYEVPYSTRRTTLELMLAKSTLIKPVEKVYVGDDESVIMPLLNKYTSIGEEGLMLNINDAPYECKRTKGLLKLKKMQTADVKVLDIYEGTGQNKGKLGGITIQFKDEDGNDCSCNCGSGFSKEERDLYWNSPELIIGKIVELQYFEITQDKLGKKGLRFPVWLSRIRHDKTEISMN